MTKTFLKVISVIDWLLVIMFAQMAIGYRLRSPDDGSYLLVTIPIGVFCFIFTFALMMVVMKQLGPSVWSKITLVALIITVISFFISL